ncbi:MAG: hypothetical protein LLG08_01245, partial [Actinomycetia bacterium]|nr:hypothetical protein [Actinomycetes bacterium]
MSLTDCVRRTPKTWRSSTFVTTSGTKQILVTAKAYPNLSSKYDETVCTAGIDLDTGRFIRLWPVRFRYLPQHQRFNKWDIIEVPVSLKRDDPRGDTYVPEMDRLTIVTERLGRLPSGKVNWKPRNDLVLPMVSTMELLDVQAKEWKGSLGVVRAINPKLRCEPTDDEWDARGE